MNDSNSSIVVDVNCSPNIATLRVRFTLAALVIIWLVESQLCFTNPEIARGSIAPLLVIITLLQTLIWILFVIFWRRRIQRTIVIPSYEKNPFGETKDLKISNVLLLVPVVLMTLLVFEIVIIGNLNSHPTVRVIEFQFLKFVLIAFLSGIALDLTETYRRSDCSKKQDHLIGVNLQFVTVKPRDSLYACIVSLGVILVVEISILFSMIFLRKSPSVQDLIRAGVIAEVGRQTLASFVFIATVATTYFLYSSLRDLRFCFRSIELNGTRLQLKRGLLKVNCQVDADVSDIERCWINRNLNLCFRMKDGFEFGGYIPNMYQTNIDKNLYPKSQLGSLLGKRARITLLIWERLKALRERT